MHIEKQKSTIHTSLLRGCRETILQYAQKPWPSNELHRRQGGTKTRETLPCVAPLWTTSSSTRCGAGRYYEHADLSLVWETLGRRSCVWGCLCPQLLRPSRKKKAAGVKAVHCTGSVARVLALSCWRSATRTPAGSAIFSVNSELGTHSVCGALSR